MIGSILVRRNPFFHCVARDFDFGHDFQSARDRKVELWISLCPIPADQAVSPHQTRLWNAMCHYLTLPANLRERAGEQLGKNESIVNLARTFRRLTDRGQPSLVKWCRRFL